MEWESEGMIENTLAMRITHEDKQYHSTEMTLKDVIHKFVKVTLGDNPNDTAGQEQEVKE